MHTFRRILASLGLAVTFVASSGTAQAAEVGAPAPAVAPPAPAAPEAAASAAPAAPETLETPYPDAPDAPAAPRPQAPAATNPSNRPAPAPRPSRMVLAPGNAADKRPALPIRARRKLALLGEIGWNGLAGFGAILTYNVDPHVALDLAGGISLLGWKTGVRGRFNLLTGSVTPFIGLGFNATSGLGEITSSNPGDDPNNDPNRPPVTVDIRPSYLVQTTLGIDFVHRRGFTLLGCIGYAQLLNRDNYRVLAGELTADEKQAFDIAFRSGVVISIALGYSFE